MRRTTEQMERDEETVLGYLRAHTDLLVRHPEVLAALEVPHACGEAVSLVEHQVAALREQNRRMKRRLRELVDNARHSEVFVRRLVGLSLGLLQCTDVEDLCLRLRHTLCEDFGIDTVSVCLFARPRVGEAYSLAGLSHVDESARALFGNMLAPGRPVCGRFKPAQLDVLFGAGAERMASSAVLPLGEAGRLGMLAMGSADPERFHPAQATDLLGHVGRLVTHALTPHLLVA